MLGGRHRRHLHQLGVDDLLGIGQPLEVDRFHSRAQFIHHGLGLFELPFFHPRRRDLDHSVNDLRLLDGLPDLVVVLALEVPLGIMLAVDDQIHVLGDAAAQVHGRGRVGRGQVLGHDQ